jgi:uncharacterized DUF497 family protein
MNHEVEFEWDSEKGRTNYRDHGIDFPTATEVFQDFFAIEDLDPRSVLYGEDRFIITGMGGGALLTVVYTERGETIRLISARKAEKHEQNNYIRRNSKP